VANTTTTVAGQINFTLSQTGTLTFPGAAVGYGSIARVPITITNTGDAATGPITITISGAQASAFYTSNTLFNSGIAQGGEPRVFEVRPNTDLAAGTYTATVTVTAGSVSRSFTMSFTVTAGGGDHTGTPNVIYNMQQDRSLHLFSGDPTESGAATARSVHPLLKSNGAARVTDLTLSPVPIVISNRGGTSQGIELLLSALNTRPNHTYRIEFSGTIALVEGGSRSLFISHFPRAEAGSGDRIGAALAEGSASSTGAFSLALNTSHETITAHRAAPNEEAIYRFGGAGGPSGQPGQNITISQILVTAYCPAGCTCAPLFPQPVTNHGPFTSRTAQEITNAITLGWNLGNTLDGHNSRNPADPPASLRNFNNPSAVETVWQGGREFRTTQSLITAVRNAGFNAIRIPVTWYKATGPAPSFTIDPRWMNHVQTVVDMAVRENMYVILNTHHEEWILRPDRSASEGETTITRLWTQIATHFRGYNERLIFEGVNEPRVRLNSWDLTEGGDPNWDWTGSDTHRTTVNRWNQAFVNAVRATGGNNEQRVLMLATYGAQGTATPLNSFRLPTDPISSNNTITGVRAQDQLSGSATTTSNKFIMSIHIYSPHAWAHNGTGSNPGRATIQTDLNRVAARRDELRIPVILGEWGCIDQHSTTLRREHAYNYVDVATRLGMRTFIWDTTRPSSSGGGSFQLLNRLAPHVSSNAQLIINEMVAAREGRARP
jgi:endoglucanase